MCASELGTDWLDAGTLALTRHLPRQPAGAPRTEGPRLRKLGFTVSYSDPNGSFEKAAKTWRESQLQMDFEVHRFRTIADLDLIFRLLHQSSKNRKRPFSSGAMFIHSSPLDGDAASTRAGLHAAPQLPRTLAELRYREEVLAPQGLDVDTAGAQTLQRIKRLSWTHDATLYVVGCLSGGTPNRSASVAQLLAQSQQVRTIGETGKAYFSTDATQFKPITKADQKVYLRAFHIKMNHVINAMEGEFDSLLSHGQAMPQRTFEPP